MNVYIQEVHTVNQKIRTMLKMNDDSEETKNEKPENNK